MYEDSNSGWGNGGPVNAIELRPGGELGIESRAPHEVQRNEGLG
jgi:hypothetical protein